MYPPQRTCYGEKSLTGSSSVACLRVTLGAAWNEHLAPGIVTVYQTVSDWQLSAVFDLSP